ncbi:YcbK family protein [Nitratireductor pacificus]|uniref:Murein endopeptidase K n=1 Tax=Nitratireductor pacificus pht-3B TaxID=391937 RepID=K2MC68_9HYPH|nr:YcbK family protein [Nitratireductor pacificus]EKF19731.1 peptidase M15A [Nitratireductor pacificus pht-3B]
MTSGFGRKSLIAAFCALLLASCSTGSDPVSQLGLAPSQGNPLAANDVNQSVEGETYVSAGNQDVTPLPQARPDQASQAGDSPTEQASGEPTEPKTTAEAPPTENAANTVAEAPSAAEPAQQVAAAKPDDEADTPAAEVAALEEPEAAEAQQTAEDTSTKKRAFLSAFFSPRQANAAAATDKIARPAAAPAPAEPEQPKVILAAAATQTKPASTAFGMGDTLPGVRQGESLFEFSSKSGSDDSDVDLYEEEPSYQVASAAGMARLAPNGLLKQRDSVDTACLKPALVGVLKAIERHYRRPIVVTSGYRSPTYNRRVRGARNSLHMYCAAADIQIEGVSKWELARYVRSMPGRGGVGTYCHTASVHVDVGPERDWNWRCRRRK